MHSLEEKLTTKWYQDYSHKLHKQRLNEIKSHTSKRIDNSVPRTIENLIYKKQGKDFLEKEKKKSIKKNNQQLLKILTEITAGKRETVTQKILKSTQNVPAVKSLNITVRKKEARRIGEDNEAFIRRLSEKPAELSAKRFNDEWEVISKYRESISRRPNRNGTSHLASRIQPMGESSEKNYNVRESESLSKTMNSINLPSIQNRVKMQMKNHDSLTQVIQTNRRRSEETARERKVPQTESLDFKRNQEVKGGANEEEKGDFKSKIIEESKVERKEVNQGFGIGKLGENDRELKNEMEKFVDKDDCGEGGDESVGVGENAKKNEFKNFEVKDKKENELIFGEFDKSSEKSVAKIGGDKGHADKPSGEGLNINPKERSHEKQEKNIETESKKKNYDEKNPVIKVNDAHSVNPENKPQDLSDNMISDDTLKSVEKRTGELLLNKNKLKALLESSKAQPSDSGLQQKEPNLSLPKVDPEDLPDDSHPISTDHPSQENPKPIAIDPSLQNIISANDPNSETINESNLAAFPTNPAEDNKPSETPEKNSISIKDPTDPIDPSEPSHSHQAKDLKPEVPEESFEKLKKTQNEDLPSALLS